jgi:hypothetical protein
MLDEDDRAGPFADSGGEPVDAFDDAAQIVLQLPVEEPDLHIDDDQCIHRGPARLCP